MIIHVYAVCHNEELLLPYFLRHYGSFSQEITIFDDSSTDRSREIIREFPNTCVVPFRRVVDGHDGLYEETVLTKIRNEEYKASRGVADWVIVADIDEFLCHPDLRSLLAEYTSLGVTIPLTRGFEMVSEHPPTTSGQIYSQFRLGFENSEYAKRSVFHPSLNIRYTPGAHSCTPCGPVKESWSAELKILHYRFMGRQHFIGKYRERLSRMSPATKAHRLGTSLLVPGGTGRVNIYQASDHELGDIYGQILAGRALETVF